MSARFATLALLVGASACGGNYVHVANGGLDLPPGSCSDVAVGQSLEVVAAQASDCAKKAAFLVPEGAAGAFWQLASPVWAGPVSSNPADVEMEVQEDLRAGEADKGLTTGSSDKGLETGTNDKGLNTGASDKGLQTGASDKGLQTGTSDKGLETGANDKGLQQGADDRGLAAGSRDKPVLRLSKRGSGRASPTSAAKFVLEVTNDSDVQVERLAVVDRVSHLLRVDASDATTSELPDHSTLVVFRSDEPLAPKQSRTFSVRVFAR